MCKLFFNCPENRFVKPFNDLCDLQEKEDASKTEKEILSLIAQHVKAVNRIYLETSFDGKYKHNGYQFEVQRIKIHNTTQVI